MFLDGLARSAKIAFPDDEAIVCVCTDASDMGWSLIVMQVGDWNDTKPLAEQPHNLLIYKGGAFKGAQIHWSIAEKEGYRIIKVAKDLEYLLHRVNGFKLFCDHANLIQIFCPSKEICTHVRGKLQRWALLLQDYRYHIEHVRGIDNDWADLVSRWLMPPTPPTGVVNRTRAAISISRLRPLQDEAFVWPIVAHVRDARQRFRRSASAGAVESEQHGLIMVERKVWIPTNAKELITRILVVTHYGLNAHRDADTMLVQLSEKYHLKKIRGECVGIRIRVSSVQTRERCPRHSAAVV